MRILLTNDDGINAPGLKVLEGIARDVAGPDGDIWVVAPAFEQSGVGHCINYTHPTMIARLGPQRYAAEGTPADCVLAGLHDVMKDSPPDLILSGVNRGNNAAENVLYSGTIGAAMEGALQGMPSIALSQYFGPENLQLEDPFEPAIQHGAETVKAIVEDGIWDQANYRLFYNVNFPPVAAENLRGRRVVRQGFREGTRFTAEPHTAPNGRRFLWIKGGNQHGATTPDGDAQANLDGYISITPLRADLTAHDVLSDLKARLE